MSTFPEHSGQFTTFAGHVVRDSAGVYGIEGRVGTRGIILNSKAARYRISHTSDPGYGTTENNFLIRIDNPVKTGQWDATVTIMSQ